MKKVLTNIILLFTFSISGMAQIEYGKTVEISKEVLLDKIKGGWDRTNHRMHLWRSYRI